MRDKINVFYYPEMVADHPTMKKAILFFDEIHFMDRPSFMFGGIGKAQFGTIGMASPVRSVEASFRENGVPVFVHGAPDGPVSSKNYENIKADVNDIAFLKKLQDGIRKSETFRRIHITPGNYGEFGNENDVARLVTTVDLDSALSAYECPSALFEDKGVNPFGLSTPAGCAKNLVSIAAVCSAKMNFALNVSSKHGFVPLADASPYTALLGTKYARALHRLDGNLPQKIPLTDLSFAVFDELMPGEALDDMDYTKVIAYRKKSQAARDEFLEHLSALREKQSALTSETDYDAAIARFVKTEIIPAAKAFRNRLQAIDDTLYGAMAKGALGGVAAGAAGLSYFGDLSWDKLVSLAGAASVYLGKAAIDKFIAERALKRECSISYVLSLDE